MNAGFLNVKKVRFATQYICVFHIGPTINCVHSPKEHDAMCLAKDFLMIQKITVLSSAASGSPSVFWIA